jgi:large subunit ribosomal protein L21e
MVHYKHHGKKSKTRYKTTKRKRERGRTPLTSVLRRFSIGEKVHVGFNPNIYEGVPFRRFIGKTGIIIGKRGSCYMIKIRDVSAEKKILVHPAHLMPQK